MAVNATGTPGDDYFDFSLFQGSVNAELLAGNDTVVGGDFSDSLSGGEGEDLLLGGLDDDTLDGGAGDDTVLGQAGNDNMSGGNGNDTMNGGSGADTLFGNDGNDTLFGSSGDDWQDGGSDHDLVINNLGMDTLYGGSGNDTVLGGDDNDLMYGGADDDQLNGQNGDDQGYGDSGDDVLTGEEGNDTLDGGEGNDTLQGNTGKDVLSGGDDDDSIDGGAGNDTLNGDAGDDAMNGASGNDEMSGGEGNDTMTGATGKDTMDGGTGGDALDGGIGDDSLAGGDGDDSLVGGTGNDTLDGGDGHDLAIYAGQFADYQIDLLDMGIRVTDTNLADGDEGSDLLTHIESLAFADGQWSPPVNHTPVAVADPLNGIEDQVLQIAPALLLANDLDADGDSLSLVGVGNATGGDVALGEDGLIRFTPVADFHGLAGFQYTLDDGQGGTATGTVNLDIAPVNDVPLPTPDSLVGAEDQPVQIAPALLLANDLDPDGDSLSLVGAGNATGGSVALGEDGLIRFTPAADFHGPAGFQYTLDDGQGGTATGTVNLDIAPVNDAPAAGDDVAATQAGVAVLIPSSLLLANDGDVDGDSLGISGYGNAVNGSLTLTEAGVLFTPDVNASGAGSFDYTLADGQGGTDTGTVRVDIEPTPAAFRVLSVNMNTNSVFQWDGVTGEFLGDFTAPSSLINPSAVEVGPDGNVYIAWGGNWEQAPSVHRYAPDGTHLGEYATWAGVQASPYSWLTDLEFDSQGYLYAMDIGSGFGNSEVFRFDIVGSATEGDYVDTYLTPENILQSDRRLIAWDVEVGPDGNLYTPGMSSHEILRFHLPGGEDFGFFGEVVIASGTVDPDNPLTYLGTAPTNNGWSFDDYYGVRPFGFDFHPGNGHMYVVADMIEDDFNTIRIIELDAQGNYVGELVPLAEGYGTGEVKTFNPFGEADFGPDGNLYVLSAHSSEVLIYGDPEGDTPGELLGKLLAPADYTFMQTLAFL